MSAVRVKWGDFVWCAKIHEDELEIVERQVPRRKRDGRMECVNWYQVPGKVRPAVVLRVTHTDAIVWYTCSTEPTSWENEDVTRWMPKDQNVGDKRTFLRQDAADIRRVPRTDAWFNGMIRNLDKTVMDGQLKKVQRFGFLRS